MEESLSVVAIMENVEADYHAEEKEFQTTPLQEVALDFKKWKEKNLIGLNLPLKY